MKRANNLLPQIEEMDNLRLAFWKASKGKRYANSVLKYQVHLEANLRDLQEQIRGGQVVVGDYRYFQVFEPKKREICASAFSEQVLHHALMNICHDHFDQVQIFDSYASRKGKGTYACLDRARQYTRRYDWFLKLDVRQFFASIHHGVLKEQLSRRFKERRLLHLFYQIIDSYIASPVRGLPIGNLTSQYFANHYLSSLDHHIKERLEVPVYVRYMDDMVCWSDDKNFLQSIKDQIEKYVEDRLQCELKPAQLNRTGLGLPFLGYRIHPYYMRLLGKSKRRFIRKLDNALNKLETGTWDQQTTCMHIKPLIAFTMHADAIEIRRCALEKYRSDIIGL